MGKNTKAYTLLHLGGSFKASENVTLNAAIYNLLDKDFVKGKAYSTYSTPNNAGVGGGVANGTAYGTDYIQSTQSTTGVMEEGRRLWLSAVVEF